MRTQAQVNKGWQAYPLRAAPWHRAGQRRGCDGFSSRAPAATLLIWATDQRTTTGKLLLSLLLFLSSPFFFLMLGQWWDLRPPNLTDRTCQSLFGSGAEPALQQHLFHYEPVSPCTLGQWFQTRLAQEPKYKLVIYMIIFLNFFIIIKKKKSSAVNCSKMSVQNQTRSIQ